MYKTIEEISCVLQQNGVDYDTIADIIKGISHYTKNYCVEALKRDRLRINNTFETEKIVCSAVYVDDGIEHKGQPLNVERGFVVCGRRHSDCYSTLRALGVLERYCTYDSDTSHRRNQCFVTSRNRMVGRKEAFILAKEAGQLIHSIDHEGDLISEELWNGFDTQPDIEEFDMYLRNKTK